MSEQQRYRHTQSQPLGWNQDFFPEFERSLKRYQKRHREAVTQLFANFNHVLKTLNLGIPPSQIHSKHIHREPCGVLAIDQRGTRVKTAELRLYIYPCEEDCTIYLIKIGDKKSQQRDIQFAKEALEEIKGGNNG